MTETKLCRKCREQKAVDEFSPDARSSDGLQPRCRACVNADRRGRPTPERAKAQAKEWVKNNPTRRQQIVRKHNWAKQGIDPHRAAVLLEVHDGTCGLCGGKSPRSKTGWQVDHDHCTGKVRAVLCQPCNVGLGRFNDDTALLQKAIEYVRRHRSDA